MHNVVSVDGFIADEKDQVGRQHGHGVHHTSDRQPPEEIWQVRSDPVLGGMGLRERCQWWIVRQQPGVFGEEAKVLVPIRAQPLGACQDAPGRDHRSAFSAAPHRSLRETAPTRRRFSSTTGSLRICRSIMITAASAT
jgi:hypothetical protein